MPSKQTPNLDGCVGTLAMIVAAVEHKAAHGEFPQFPLGKTFEQWAGDMAAKALGYSAVPALDKFIVRGQTPLSKKV